jgi:hypothetical protein
MAAVNLVAFCGLNGATALSQTEDTVLGTVYSVPWEKDAITVVTEMGEEFFIANQPFAKEFFKLEKAVVRVFGFKGKGKDGFNTFTVTRFEVIKVQ